MIAASKSDFENSTFVFNSEKIIIVSLEILLFPFISIILIISALADVIKKKQLKIFLIKNLS